MWRSNFGRSHQEPSLPGDFNHDSTADDGDYVVWRKLGMNASEYNTWRQNFGQTLQTGSGAATTSSSLAGTTAAQAASATEAVLFQEAPLAASRTESDPAPVAATQSNAKSQYFDIDFDFGSLSPASHVGTTSAARSRMATPIASDAKRRDDLLALYQAIRATDEGFAVPTAFDVDWHTDTASSVEVDDFDIHVIDDAFEEL